ncbi:hypothetical protein AALO_G00120970 [Alosa alosa]|uniref:Growth arrest and DNA damage-inducible protein GADD45 alpha n=2 Tax=Clupeidae TaxID=55118 RepID=A0AAV6GPP4_9TELE|nr:hypothetical protein AALO_G00120970 [Alosa alosa]
MSGYLLQNILTDLIHNYSSLQAFKQTTLRRLTLTQLKLLYFSRMKLNILKESTTRFCKLGLFTHYLKIKNMIKSLCESQATEGAEHSYRHATGYGLILSGQSALTMQISGARNLPAFLLTFNFWSSTDDVPTVLAQKEYYAFHSRDIIALPEFYPMCNMTFEEPCGDNAIERMDSVARAVEDVLSAALPQGCITVGVYEAAKSLNVDPDNVVLCLLATDEEDVQDVALQIHFTLIQAFCCENDINILRVNNMQRLAEILGGMKPGGEPMDLHCVLVTNPQSSTWKDPALSKLNRFCRDSRVLDQWVPVINLPER